MDHDNTANLHQIMVHPDCLYGSKVIETLLQKPEYSFMNRYFYVLYRSIIPNRRITLPILHKSYNIGKDVEDYILTGASAKLCIQKILNFLFVCLDNEKDYMKFCLVINSISVMTNLPHRMIYEFNSNGHWPYVPIHPKLVPSKLQQHQPTDDKICANDNVDKSNRPIAMESIHPLVCDSLNQDWVDCKGSQGATGAIHASTKRRDSSVSTAKSRIHMPVIQGKFSELVELLPTNCYSTICKLRKMVNFADVDEKMSSKLSEHDDASVINDQLLSYIVDKCAGNVVLLWDVLEEVVSTSKKKQLRIAPFMQSSLKTEFAAQSSLQCSVSLTGPVVNVVHEEDQPSASFVSSSTSCVPTSEDHHVHICTTTISNEVSDSLNVTEPKCSTDISSSANSYEESQLPSSTSTIDNKPIFSIQEMKELTPGTTAMNTKVSDIQQSVKLSAGFVTLKSKYQNILKYFPKDFYQSLQVLQDQLTDDHLCAILNCSDSDSANKLILDCLIDATKSEDDLLDQLDRLTDASPDLKHTISELRKGNKEPQYPDLYKDVAPKYAARWKDLGVELRIPMEDLNAIQLNNVNHPSHSQQCCKDMLHKWMQMTSKPTWNILQKAIDSLPLLSHDGNSKRVKYLQPPSLPTNHIDRHALLDEIATKLLETTNDPNKHETTLTLTGAGGFGKTMTATSLCHHPRVKEQFTNGFAFIELGPQATDPSVKLNQLYHLLTGEYLCDINHAEQEIKQLTNVHYRNLLVIIDDAWHVEDAEPFVKAFSNCKIILTTRMKDIERYIPSTYSVTIGPMTDDEAVSLLTSKIIDSSQLSQEDVNLLHEISQDVHLWPLLLSLIRGQLFHYLKHYHLSHHKAIENVQVKLRHQGLTAFDKNDIDIKKSRNLAVKACIEITLQLLTNSISDKMKMLILHIGIGTSIQTDVLNNLWNTSKQEAAEIVDVLWGYGLVQFTNITISPNNIMQHLNCVGVHAVISQYIVEHMDSKQVCTLHSIVLQNVISVAKELSLAFEQAYGVSDPSSITAENYLKYMLSLLENVELQDHLKGINMSTINDPHNVILILQDIKDALMTSPYTINLLSLLREEINSLTVDCKQSLKNAHKLCRKLNQSAQRNIHEKCYDKLIATVEEFIKNYPVCNVAQKAVTMVKKIIPYCDGKLLHYMMMKCERLQMKTHKYHDITTLILPQIKLRVKMLIQITSSLLNGSPSIEQTDHYIRSGKFNEDQMLVNDNYLISLQDVAPMYVQRLALQQDNILAKIDNYVPT